MAKTATTNPAVRRGGNPFRHKAGAYRSGLEESIQRQLTEAGITARYEPGRIEYAAAPKHYTPDFVLPNGIVLETKGYFLPADRTKHIAIKKQHPGIDLRFIFQNPNARLSKASHTTYAVWCEKNGFLYASKRIPEAWLNEQPEPARQQATKELIKPNGKRN